MYTTGCTPDCDGKNCGDDGCGGSCGGCPDGQTCNAGLCAANGACGDVTTKGVCDGNTLKYCSGGEIKTFDCTEFSKVCGYDAQFDWFDCVESDEPCVASCDGKVCGSDGCGGSCGNCLAGQTCDAAGQCVGGDNGDCGNITSKGVCEGNTLKYCSGGDLKTYDCGEFSKVCGYDDQFDWFDCIEDGGACTPSCAGKTCGDDGCGGSCGSCDAGQTCNAGQCVADGGGTGACGDITTKGTCDGNTLKYCSGGEIKTYDCTAFSKVCGYDDQFDWFDCIEDPDTCTPNCNGKSCGSDGCGGSCGTCPSGQSCNGSGQCQADGGACGSLTSKGKCDGNTLSYCSSNEIKTFNCTAFCKVCGYDAQFDWYDCIEDPDTCSGGWSCMAGVD